MTPALKNQSRMDASNFTLGTARTSPSRERLSLIVHVISWLCVSLSLGFSYKVGNQHSYLISGLRRLDPGFLPRDWILQETTVYHPTFDWIVVMLGTLFGGGAGVGWGLIVLNVLVVSAAMGAFSYLFRQVCQRSWFWSLGPVLVVALWMVLGLHKSPAVSYAFASTLQPSSLASMALCWAVVFYGLGRRSLAGLALAVSGFFHANFLVLGLLVFGLSQLVQMAHKRGLLIKENAMVMGPALLVFLTKLPVLLSVSGQSSQGIELFHRVRSPWHYDPSTYGHGVWLYLGWTILGAAAYVLGRRQSGPTGALMRRLGVLWVMCQVCIFGYFAVAAAGLSAKVTQLFMWRLAPFASLMGVLAMVLVAGPALSELRRRVTQKHSASAMALAAAGGAVVFLMIVDTLFRGGMGPVMKLSIWVALFCGWVWVSSQRKAKWWVVFCLGAFVVLSGLSVRYATTLSNAPDFEHTDEATADVYQWINTQTPKDALFVIPPLAKEFRLHAGRSVIADWKTTPVISSELMQWYERMQDISGVESPKDKDAISEGYTRIDEDRVRMLVEKYGADHALVPASALPALKAYEPLYQSDEWAVISLKDTKAQLR